MPWNISGLCRIGFMKMETRNVTNRNGTTEERHKLVMRLVTDRIIKDRDGNTIPDWINATAWNGLAEVIEKYHSVGDTIYVRGQLFTSTYKKKHQIEVEGKTYVIEVDTPYTELLIREFEFVNARRREKKSNDEHTVKAIPIDNDSNDSNNHDKPTEEADKTIIEDIPADADQLPF